MTFAERLRELRDARGLSEAKLAQASGVPFGTLHNYGQGLRKPTFAATVKIARALGVDCTAFADCEDVNDAEEPARSRGRPRKAAAEPKPARKPRKGKVARKEQ